MKLGKLKNQEIEQEIIIGKGNREAYLGIRVGARVRAFTLMLKNFIFWKTKRKISGLSTYLQSLEVHQ